MSANSAIEWTTHTFNPWWGCTKVSPGCTNCYADTLATRYGHSIWGPKAERRFFGDKHWAEPLKWNAKAEREGIRARVFCASMADVFERHMLPNVQSQLVLARSRLWCLIEETPYLDWLLLTKRPENIREMLPVRWLHEPPHNVWYGTSVEDQQRADERIPHLLRVPATVRFLSCEPLLGPVDLEQPMPGQPRGGVYPPWYIQSGIDWVIVGGESGPQARGIAARWIRSLRNQCQRANVAFFFKQWGEWLPFCRTFDSLGDPMYKGADGRRLYNADILSHAHEIHHDFGTVRLGKKAAGRLLDGVEWSQFPEAVCHV